MHESILPILKEQAFFGFTGRINILLGNNKQHIGVIIQANGHIVNAEYHSDKGKKALFNALFEDIEGHTHFKYVVEPEIIGEKDYAFHFTFDDLYKKLQTRFEQYKKFKKFRPPKELKLYLKGEFMNDIHGYSIGPEEFDTLLTLVEHPLVEDIYRKSPLYEYQITRALVSLRNKKALKVSQ